ncbi:MAG: M3 family metallopeptidase, partial [Bacteroidaceae bacterium]|nr:M3 family metallopeptidase [Bacteroidaceae bacterium]
MSEAMKNFGQNILKETNAIEIYTDDVKETAGLPANVVENAATEAEKRGHDKGWSFTLHAPSRLAVLASADSRNLRERMYKAYTSLCSNANEYNNEENINTILSLRYQKARLLGFNSFADFMLDNVMAKTVANAEELLYKIWEPAKKKVAEEVADMQALADKENAGIKIEPWDYSYYAEKVKKDRYNLSEEETRPYFAIDSVVNGIFYVANRLHGTTFNLLPDAPKYHPEVNVYDVKDAEGKHLSIFMTDYFPRDTKRGGAWMSELKGEASYNGLNERPIIYNVGNMTRPTKDTPSLLTLDEVLTVFHEFGHAMHGMFTTAEYRSQSGTNIDRNMVELPSQINEHWAVEPEVLKHYAHHYKTGEPMPDDLIAKMEAAGKFNQGFMTTELAAASLLDLEWHKQPYTEHIDVKDFERKVSEKLGKPELVEYRYRSPYFRHIFGSNGYASGYYTYLWAEVLDADGFELFKEKGIFDPATAKAYRENILESGDSEDAMTLYVRFRGHKPSPDALLRNRGLE